jgi:N-acetylmuramoyl-L-alanine amidase
MRPSEVLARLTTMAVLAVMTLAWGFPLAASASAETGPDVAFEQRLADLGYDPGVVDGSFDQDTSYAITAFQKVHGQERTGTISDEVRVAVGASSPPPAPLVPDGGPNRVEIDLARQVLFLYENGALTKILPVSTGSGEEFCSDGWCRNAVTNEGSFEIYRQVSGWDDGPLGALYNPQYFDGGIAIHGSESVPAEPVSHGCVRIPISAAEWFPDHVSVGTPVYVVAGGAAEPTPTAAAATQEPARAPATAPVSPTRTIGSGLMALLALLRAGH